ncbi:MAG TPA: MAPEG family protein [Xanthomonadaceae bacterium]|nr:MAPEG family protein [Xanthomonadaceae bacterium]
MALAYWCLLIAALLPYLWVSIAKASGERYDNRNPRAWQARQDNPRSQRAYAAQLNGFEAFAPFAAAVLMAQAAGIDPARIGQLAVAFVVLRVLHGLFYVLGIAALRSLSWAGGIAVVVWLMLLAAQHAA